MRFEQGLLHEGESEEGAAEAEEGAGDEAQGGGAFAQAEELGDAVPGQGEGEQAQHPPGDAAQAFFCEDEGAVGQEHGAVYGGAAEAEAALVAADVGRVRRNLAADVVHGVVQVLGEGVEAEIGQHGDGKGGEDDQAQETQAERGPVVIEKLACTPPGRFYTAHLLSAAGGLILMLL